MSRDDFARMHDEYLDPDRYFGNQEQPLQLHEDKTLRGYGRRQHGLNGKDADLDPCGQIVIDSAWWFADGPIQVTGSCYADICPPLSCQAHKDSLDWEIAQEIICNLEYPGEWSDDYWSISGGKFALDVACEWHDDETDEQNISRATQAAYDAVMKHCAEFQQAVAYVHKQFNEIGQS